MASRFPTETVFDRISQEISKTFNELIKQLTVRRDQLLAEVEGRRKDFEQRMKAQEETLKTLENIQSQLEKLNSQQNPASNQIQSSLAPVQKQIDEIIQPPNLKFECPTRMITETLMKLGSILLNNTPVLTINYFSKMKARQVIPCKSPCYLHVSTDVYVILGSGSSSYIEVFDAKYWRSKYVIKEYRMEPAAVVADEHHCYVVFSNWKGGYRYFISKFDKSTIIQSEMFNVGSLRIASMARLRNEIFVADEKYIRVFDTDLNSRRRFEFDKVRCIQFKDDNFYVLDNINTSLNIFDSSLQKIGTSHQFSKPLTNQNSEDEIKPHNIREFCFDPSGNALLVKVNESDQVVVQSSSGEELYTIGEDCQCNEELSKYISVGVYGDNIIVACSYLDCIKIF